jgi:hypothetical protein
MPYLTVAVELRILNQTLAVVIALHKLDRNSLLRMPPNMTVHEPRTRVIRCPS